MTAAINEFSTVTFGEQSGAGEKPESRSVSDLKLAQKAADGDIEAFEKLYWQYHQMVYCVCLRMTKNAAEAEDVAQKVFLQLFRKISSFRGESAFSTWLHRLTVNQVLMHFRYNKARKDQTTEDGELPEESSVLKNRFGANQMIDRLLLNDAIAQLPEGYRKVVVLHDIQGFDHEEIGQMLGCAAGTSKSQLFKARRKLRKLLGNDTEILNQPLQEAIY